MTQKIKELENELSETEMNLKVTQAALNRVIEYAQSMACDCQKEDDGLPVELCDPCTIVSKSKIRWYDAR